MCLQSLSWWIASPPCAEQNISPVEGRRSKDCSSVVDVTLTDSGQSCMKYTDNLSVDGISRDIVGSADPPGRIGSPGGVPRELCATKCAQLKPADNLDEENCWRRQ